MKDVFFRFGRLWSTGGSAFSDLKKSFKYDLGVDTWPLRLSLCHMASPQEFVTKRKQKETSTTQK